jgi:hypothetical protein
LSEAKDVFVPGLIVGKSAGIVAVNGDVISAKSALGANSAAPADNPAIANPRRDIPIDSACFTGQLL